MHTDETNITSDAQPTLANDQPGAAEDAGIAPRVGEESSATAEAPDSAAEETATVPTNPPSDNETLETLTRRIEEIAESFREANALSRERERIVDRLHEENQELRSGELWQALAPVFRDLVRLYDDLELTTRRYESKTEIEVKEVALDFQSFRDAVADVLYRHGVERYGATEGAPFNSKEHKALGVVATSDPSLDRAVACVVRSGFRTESRVLRILEAEVFRFSATPSPAEKENLSKEESKVIA